MTVSSYCIGAALTVVDTRDARPVPHEVLAQIAAGEEGVFRAVAQPGGRYVLVYVTETFLRYVLAEDRATPDALSLVELEATIKTMGLGRLLLLIP